MRFIQRESTLPCLVSSRYGLMSRIIVLKYFATASPSAPFCNLLASSCASINFALRIVVSEYEFRLDKAEEQSNQTPLSPQPTWPVADRAPRPRGAATEQPRERASMPPEQLSWDSRQESLGMVAADRHRLPPQSPPSPRSRRRPARSPLTKMRVSRVSLPWIEKVATR